MASHLFGRWGAAQPEEGVLLHAGRPQQLGRFLVDQPEAHHCVVLLKLAPPSNDKRDVRHDRVRGRPETLETVKKCGDEPVHAAVG